MKLLDLFCCEGGAGMGYAQAGFEVTGVDAGPQPRYPFEFILSDAIDYLRANYYKYHAVHASPPCQRYSILTPTEHKGHHPDMIDIVREELIKTGLPYIIENVPGARYKLKNPVMLCGSMFGLKVYRHRYFEISGPGLWMTPTCKHDYIPTVVSGTTKRLENGKRREHTARECREAMNINWMTRKGLDQAIPPAYTEWIGKQLIQQLKPITL